jgi:molybdenum cofactor biosynthesis enzyme MoaA
MALNKNAFQPIEKNRYDSVMVDITNRCNLSCQCCYHPDRNDQELSLEAFSDLMKRLPGPTTIKISGGEPTLHREFPQMVRVAHALGHNVVILSNGTTLMSDKILSYFVDLNRQGIPFTLTITFDGGFHDPKPYELINNDAHLLQVKKAVFQRLIQARVKQLCLGALIVRGCNEQVIPELIETAQTYPAFIRYLHFRGVGPGGRYLEEAGYTVKELKQLVAPYFSSEAFRQPAREEAFCPPTSTRDCCYRFRPGNRLQISLIEFTDQTLTCPKRGRVRLGSNLIEPLAACYDSTLSV